jgi:hypothetical protein
VEIGGEYQDPKSYPSGTTEFYIGNPCEMSSLTKLLQHVKTHQEEAQKGRDTNWLVRYTIRTNDVGVATVFKLRFT